MNADFPHEIGLFLGYPPEDVEGFIRFGGKNCKCFGCWKVYGNIEAAHQCFERFKKCTACYCERYRLGCPLDALVVAQLALPYAGVFGMMYIKWSHHPWCDLS